MSARASTLPLSRLEHRLALLLQYGTLIASLIIAAGLAAALAGLRPDRHVPQVPDATFGLHVMAAGIALVILLPVLRVTLMLAVFIRERDYRFGLAAAFVLVVIALGFTAGMLPALRG
jgi:Protein of unknown function (DUF1634)